MRSRHGAASTSALRALQSGNQPLAALELGERELATSPTTPTPCSCSPNWPVPPAARKSPTATSALLKLAAQQWQALQVARAWGEGLSAMSRKKAGRGLGIAFDNRIFTPRLRGVSRKPQTRRCLEGGQRRRPPGADDLAWRAAGPRCRMDARPQTALDNWLQVARQQARTSLAGRAAPGPGLFDDAALIPALHYQIARQPQTSASANWWRRRNAWRTPPGHRLSRTLLSQRQPRPEILELLAELAERAGETDTALRRPGNACSPTRHNRPLPALRVAA